jgi:hypothetical protein
MAADREQVVTADVLPAGGQDLLTHGIAPGRGGWLFGSNDIAISQKNRCGQDCAKYLRGSLIWINSAAPSNAALQHCKPLCGNAYKVNVRSLQVCLLACRNDWTNMF